MPLPRRAEPVQKQSSWVPHPPKTVVGAGKVGEAAKARSVCSAAVDKRAFELARPALEEYMASRIDEAELKRRKAVAREKAAAEHKPLATLDAAFAAYTKAVAAREKAYQAYTKAEEAEDAAEAKLTAALREHEKGQAGPSGAVKAG